MKKKTIKPPLAIRVIGSVFPVVEKVVPWLAHRWFVNMFYKPLKYKVPHGEVDAREEAEMFQLSYNNKNVQCYKWGEGKPILFVHGWMGRGTQFRKFIAPFNQAGYSVISFDAPAHGLSEGKTTYLLEFIDIIELLRKKYGDFEMVVGHSLGGVACLHAINNGMKTDKLIMISSPTDANRIVWQFQRIANASDKCRDYFNEEFKKANGVSFVEYAASAIITKVRPIELLLIHDENDYEVSIDQSQLIKELYPSAEFIVTKGLGHTRILKDEVVVAKTLNFIQPVKV